MAVFLTGTTGYLGSYVAHGLLSKHKDRLALLVRAKSIEEAQKRLWKSLQLHMGFQEFFEHLQTRIDIYLGDLTEPGLGLDSSNQKKLIQSMDSVIHCAASLNRKSAKACFNVNLRGTLHILKLTRQAQEHHGLRRFSEVSTVAVAGRRKNETLSEDKMLEWDRSDYDPYARTKKFCEYMLHELLPDVEHTVFRPSIILGDSRFPETTQFDMVRAFVWLAKLHILPFQKNWRLDIVPANYVSQAIVHIHQKEKPGYNIYNLSSGTASQTYGKLVKSLEESGLHTRHRFLPWLHKPFEAGVTALASTPHSWNLSRAFSLLKVFLPYLTFNTVFDNSRVQEELGKSPRPFSEYAYPLFCFAKKGKFTYPYQPWPESKNHRKVA